MKLNGSKDGLRYKTGLSVAKTAECAAGNEVQGMGKEEEEKEEREE